MVDTACVMYSFSTNESIEGNAKRALGESISFGRFITDQSLSCENWSAFPHKKYVEEAERYARPGSVALKKAFFEAHYKKIAAQRAADLVEQQGAAETEPQEAGDNNASVDAKMMEVKIQDSKQDDATNVNEHSPVGGIENGKDGENAVSTASGSPAKINHQLVNIQNNGTRSTEKSHLDSEDGKRLSSKSLSALMNLVPNNRPDRDSTSVTKKTENSPKDCSTAAASTKGVSSSYTKSGNRRIKIPNDPSAPGSKPGHKWRILSAVCSKSLRTEERAAKRKQKVGEEINANKVQEVEQQKPSKVKAGNEVRKLSCGFCFKAQPLLDSYEDGETPRNQIEKTPAISKSRSEELQRRNSKNKMQGSISVPPPPPPPPPTCPIKNSPSKNLLRK